VNRLRVRLALIGVGVAMILVGLAGRI